MAYKRKRKYSCRSSQTTSLPRVVDFTAEEREAHFTNAVELFNLHKEDGSVCWEMFNPNYFIKGSTVNEVQVKFVDDISTTADPPKDILLGKLNITSNANGIFDIVLSEYVNKAAICWLTERQEQLLCVWVTLPSSGVKVVLGTSITINFVNASAIAEFSRHSGYAGLVQLVSKPCNQDGDKLDIDVFAMDRVLNVGGADHLPLSRASSLPVSVIRLFNDIDGNLTCNEEKIDLDFIECRDDSVKGKIFQFYKWVRFYQNSILQSKELSPLPTSISGLTASLHKYQISAVQWMLGREGAQGWADKDKNDNIHPLWQPINSTRGDTLYYNRYTGKLSFERYGSPSPVKGGILADEMGLGKTVEVLALILIHKFQSPVNPISRYLSDISFDQFAETLQADYISMYKKKRESDAEEMGLEENVINNEDYQEEAETNGNHGDDVWCLCGSSYRGDGREWVQCCVCKVWQHSVCSDHDSSIHEDLICVRCLLKKPISCGTTLIIVPESLLHQWLEELAKHTHIESLNVMVYTGVNHRYINPLCILSQDIVMVTYESLRRELDRVHHQEFTRMLRKKKKWAYPPSPLLAIQWWRVCLDEAQMVESVNTKTAEMTRRLTSVNRWCVTGTPVQRNLADLFGLVYFLGYSPYCVNQWWKRLIWLPYCGYNPRPMVELFADLMWRNSKEDVADELSIPEMNEETHWLTFSAVESYFYKKQENYCKEHFLKAVDDLELDNCDYTVSELNRSTVPKLLNPLLALRQACGHPQLVKEGYVSITHSSKSHMTMFDLLKKLVLQAKQEGRENLRQLIAGLNGQAGLLILQRKFDTAIYTYRGAMTAWKTHEENFICDRMQRIHTMENLASLLEKGHAPYSRALSDDNLRREANVLRAEYLKNYEHHLIAGVDHLSIAANTTEKALEKVYHYQKIYHNKEEGVVNNIDPTPSPPVGIPKEDEMDDDDVEVMDTTSVRPVPIDCKRFDQGLSEDIKDPPHEFWWSSVIGWAKGVTKDQDLLALLETDIQSTLEYRQNSSFIFRELSGLDLAIVNYITRIQTVRVHVLKSLGVLSHPGVVPDDLVTRAVACHIRSEHPRRFNNTELCEFCQVESEIDRYKEILFGIGRFTVNNRDTAYTICEKTLRCMLAYIKARGAPHMLCLTGDQFMHYLEALKREFKFIKKLWLKAEQKARGCDELRMCSSRLALVEDAVPGQRNMASLYLTRSQIGPKMIECTVEADSAEHKLKKSFGQLMYLQNLVRANKNTDNTDEGAVGGEAGGPSLTCPVCTIELEVEWSVLSCGHSLCMECLDVLIKRHAGPYRSYLPRSSHVVNFPCPMCRDVISSNTVHYIKTNKKADEFDSVDDDVMEQYSTKVRSIVTTLKKIKLQEPGAKALVFSSFFEVLKLISRALEENEIQHSFLQSKNDFKTNLQHFKSSSILNVLLLPMSSGSKGLNITEATHVLLVEPCLNIGGELQAIGRIHRVGQTKPTTVHRFYIRNTIEESIKTIMDSSTNLSNFIVTSTITEQECNLTVKDLQSLLLQSNDHQLSP